MTESRKPGRPPLDKDDRTVTVTVSLPSKKFDELCARAQREGVSIPAIVRALLRRHWREPEQ